MSQYIELLGGVQHDCFFDPQDISPRRTVPGDNELLLRADCTIDPSVTTATVDINGTQCALDIETYNFDELDNPSLTRLQAHLGTLALKEKRLIIGSPLGARAAALSAQRNPQLSIKIGWPLGFRAITELKDNQVTTTGAYADGVFIPIPQNGSNENYPITQLGNIKNGVPLINCMKDEAYIRDSKGMVHQVPRAPKPLRFSLQKKRIGYGQQNIPVYEGYVKGIKGLRHIRRLPADALLLIYSDMLNWVDRYAPKIADRVVCGGRTERDPTTLEPRPIMQSLVRYSQESIENAREVGF